MKKSTIATTGSELEASTGNAMSPSADAAVGVVGVDRARAAARARSWRLLALGLILCIGAALRMIDLSGTPPGLWFDEALNGQDAMAVWQPGGHFKLVYPDEFPREPLYETLLALVVRVAGPSVTAMRAQSAVIGILTILLLYLFVKDQAGTGAGLCAAGVLATLRWQAIFSRLIFRTIILGPWMLGVVWAALSYRRRPTPGRAALLGALIGGGFYTYLAWYFLLPLVAGIALWLAWNDRKEGHGWRGAALALAVAALVYLPLGVHYLHNPQDLLARPGAVSVFSGGLGAGIHEILKNAAEASMMFFWRGDHVPKHNIPHRAALDALQGLAFLCGLWVCIGGIRRRRALPAILLLWIAFGLAATVFTHTDSPNFLRTLCVTPAVATVCGLGLAGVGRWIGRKIRPTAGVALIATALILSAGWTGWDIYFNWARRGDVWQGYLGSMAQLARGATAAPEDVAVFVPQKLYEHRSFQFQTMGRENIFPYADWRVLAPWPMASRGAKHPEPRKRWIIVTANNNLLQPLETLVPQGGVIEGFKVPKDTTGAGGNTWAVIYDVPENSLPPEGTLQELQAQWRRPMDF